LYPRFTYSTEGFFVHEPSNDGAGKTIIYEKTKAPDFDTWHFGITFWPGLKPNDSNSQVGHKSARWINARGVGYELSRQYKIASTSIFKDDQHQRFLWFEFLGELPLWKDEIGLCYSDAKLAAVSAHPSYTVTPYIGNFAQHMNTSCAFPVGAIGNFKLCCEVKTRSLQDLIINEFVGDAAGLFIVPKDSCTGLAIESSSIKTILAARYAWVDEAERAQVTQNYRECKFKEMRFAGETTIEPAQKRRNVNIDLSCMGMGTQFILTIQEEDDIANLNWLKTNGTEKADFIRSAVMMYNDKACEDALPAEFSRGAQIINAWKVAPGRCVYLIHVLENEARSTIFSGGKNMGVFQKVVMQLDTLPNTKALYARVDMLGWQAYYTTKSIAFLTWV
jgi:hypothetical protein